MARCTQLPKQLLLTLEKLKWYIFSVYKRII